MNRKIFIYKRISVTHCLWFLTIVLVAIITAKVMFQFTAASVQDDAYMFTRYADNILITGTPSFNPGCEATYGLTSPVFLGVVLPIRAILPQNTALTMLCSSALCGLIFIGLLIILVRNSIDGMNPQLNHIITLTVLLSFAFAANSFSTHFLSGMDTMSTLAFLTGYIFVCMWHQRSLTVSSTLLTGCMGGLAFSFRPDLLIYTFTVPLVILLFSSGRRARLTAAGILSITSLTVVFQILFYSKYLNSPLPLSFYAKSTSLYGNYLGESYHLLSLKQLCKYIFSFPLLFSAIGIALFIDFRRWWHRISVIGKGLLLATAAFFGYHLFFVIPIMGYSQRFYYPTLPALVFLAVRSVVFIVERTSLNGILHKGLMNRADSKAILAVMVLLLVFSFGSPVAREVYHLMKTENGEYRGFDVTEEYRDRWTGYWFCLDEFSRLPDDMVIAATEIGHPLAMNPGKTILDLSGLNETMIAHNGFSPDSFFHRYQPDLIYMPHPDYREMIRQIYADPFFINHYEVFSSSDLSTTMALALNRDSEYYESMLQIVSDNIMR
ncbi:MAG: hypothetical protein KAW14_10985 [Candidatus Aegiribacteria sp.]|nr:hypothetical protein [Candidatus Aegiribacteria sp.]